jgi:N-acetylglucosaminyldiphosphoundecaprenol N-acetyl-beta-D-mannosaminyltransferase
METAEFLGVRINPCPNDVAVNAILHAASTGSYGYVCIANVDMLTRAKRSIDLHNALRASLFTFMDGMPVVWALKLKGLYYAERNYGPSLMLSVCEKAAQEKIPIFLYGGSPDELRALQSALKQRISNLRIAGAISPPLLPQKPRVDSIAIEEINRSGAGIVFVGLGCPKQEHWMAVHGPHLHAVCIGVGLAFAQNAGRIAQAPAVLQRMGMEWLFRLAQEPKRLWRRYLVGNSFFIWYCLVEMGQFLWRRATALSK